MEQVSELDLWLETVEPDHREMGNALRYVARRARELALDAPDGTNVSAYIKLADMCENNADFVNPPQPTFEGNVIQFPGKRGG